MINFPKMVSLGDVIAKRNGSVDPTKFPNECFELLSIPAFDAGKPEVVYGTEIGSTKQIVQPGDVLLSKIVPHIRRAWIVRPITQHRLIASGEWIVFRDTRFEPAYLKHLLTSDQFHRQYMQTVSGVGGSLLRARPTEVAKIQVPLPSKVEQQHIATILDKADSLRRKRKEAIRLADEFLQASYLELASRQNDRVTIDSVLADIPNAARTGPFGSQMLVSEFQESGIPVLGIDNVVQNRFCWGAKRFISEAKYKELERYTVRPGDVMVTIMGTTGRVAIAPDDIPTCISTKHLCTLTLNRSKMLPEYLWACLRWDPEVKAQTQREAKGAIMEGWNMGIVKALEIRRPSLDEQQRFVSKVHTLRRLKSRTEESLSLVDDLVSSLTNRFFTQ